MEGKNDTATFLPLKVKGGSFNSSNKNTNLKQVPFSTEDQAEFICNTKLLDTKEHITLTMKIKIIRNRAMFKVTNGTHETVTFDPTQMLGIIDLRSLGYYKIKQGVLQQNLSHMYHFESASEVCAQFNKLINILRKEERRGSTEKYPWLDEQ